MRPKNPTVTSEEPRKAKAEGLRAKVETAHVPEHGDHLRGKQIT